MLWKEGKIDILLREGKAIQRQLQRKPRAKEEITKIFSRLMIQGKVTAALKFLESEAQAGGILPLNDETLQGLYEKHPPPKDIKPFSLLYGPIDNVPSTYFESIDEELIQKAAIATHGAAGPSKLDADQYQRMLCSRNFKTEGLVLRNEIATLAKKLATENLDPTAIESYNANRLIPLDKCPRICPIGVGEILRRIIGKSISWTLKKDIQEAVGPLQTCSGLNSGGEAAIHAMKEIFDEEETDGVILVDASNAFNNMNRLVALHNIRVICPAISTILINMYQIPTRLFIARGGEILSREGTTQGDNLAMPFYALGTSILIYSNNNAKQKKGNVLPIHKKENRQLKKNYRPISLLPVCGKIFEKLIFDAIYEYFCENQLLTPSQSGFRPGDSTVNQLLSITHKIYSAFEEFPSRETRAIFLDISKAFDKVWHDGLLFKLKCYGISDCLFTLIEDFLRNRQQRVVLNGKSSGWSSVTAGMPQGSVLGPLFFWYI